MIDRLKAWYRRRGTARRRFGATDSRTFEPIVAAVEAHVAHRETRYGTEASLPYPRAVVEAALLEAIRHCQDPARRRQLCALYVSLDDNLLNPAEAAAVNRWHRCVAAYREHSAQIPLRQVALAAGYEVFPILERLAQAMQDRLDMIEFLLRM